MFREEVETVTRLAGPIVHRATHFTSGPKWLGKVLQELAAIHLDWIADLLDLEQPSLGRREREVQGTRLRELGDTRRVSSQSEGN